MVQALDVTADELRYPYLAALNDAQREAVQTLDGPVLVLAGAGTGKTRALTTRLAHLLITGRATPGQLLAVTFTNKAAREMKNRVAALIGRPVEGWWLGTFHALSARLLREDAERVGLRRTSRSWTPTISCAWSSSCWRPSRSTPRSGRRARSWARSNAGRTGR